MQVNPANPDEYNTLLGNRLAALAVAIADLMQRDLIPSISISGSQLSVLVVLHSFPESSIEDLSKTLQLSHSNLVRAVDQLRIMGLISKSQAKDHRATSLSTTQTGEAILSKFYQARAQQLQSVLVALTAQQQQQLEGIVDQLLASFPDGKLNDGRICRYCDMNTCYYAHCPLHWEETAPTISPN